MHDGVQAPPLIWYAAQSTDLTHPIDRRRFPWWASVRGVGFQTNGFQRDVKLAVLTPMADLPFWLTLRSRNPGLRLMFDMVDNYLTDGRGNLRDRLRSLERILSRRFSFTSRSYEYWLHRTLHEADAVVVGSAEQAARMHLIRPGALPVADWHGEYPDLPLTQPADGSALTLLWEGQGVTLKHLLWLSPTLKQLAKQVGRVQLEVLSSMTTPRFGDRYFLQATEAILQTIRSERVAVRLVPWSPSAVADASRRAHLAIIPIDPTDQFARLKPENKLLIYWRLGLPTLVSPTPSYTRVMNTAEVPGLCGERQEWIARASDLTSSPSKRQLHVERGKNYLNHYHQDKQLLSIWDTAIQTAFAK